MFDSEVTLVVLSPNEKVLGFLHPKYVDVTETIDGLKSLRTIQITHPLIDDQQNNLNKYNNLLSHGNKIWWDLTPNGDGCLYVLLDSKTVDTIKNTVVITAEEVATELSMIPSIRFTANLPIQIDTDFINTYFGNWFTAGNIESCTLNYIGTIGLMALLTLIGTQCSKEIQFRYIYNPTSNIISRYIDIIPTKGVVHSTPVEIGYNTQDIILEDTETTVAIASAPIGTPSDTTDVNISAYNTALNAFVNMSVYIGQMIPSSVDSSGVLGASIPAPFSKNAGSIYIQCPVGESAADYQTVRQKEKQINQYPRTILFSTTETNMYNLYWLCVSQIQSNMQPSITLTAQVVDIQEMQGNIPEYYNIGDTVPVKLPGRTNRVSARIIKTVKDPRTPDKDTLTIGNYVLNFFTDYLDINENNILPYQ